MAKKSYAQRNAESIAKYGKSLYERRIESATARGLSKTQASGHAKKTELPASKVSTRGTQGARGTRGSRQPKPAFKPPKITKRFQTLGNGTRIVQTRSTEQIARSLQGQTKGVGAGKLNRVYFSVFDPTTGKNVNVYYGKPGKKGFHGITIEEFMRRVEEKMESGDYDSFDDALWDTLVEDADGDYMESEGYSGGSMPSSMSQVTMYIRPAN